MKALYFATTLAASLLNPIAGMAATAPAKITTPVRTKDNVELFVKDWGRGPAVVFVHGWPLNADSWDYYSELLANSGYRAISYDRRGFGRSGQSGETYDYDTLADDLDAVIRASGEKQVTLVGYSMGGGDVVRYVTRHGSSRVAQIVLVATIVPGLLKTTENPNGIPEETFDGIKKSILADRPKAVADLIRDVIYDVGNNNTHPVSKEQLDWTNAMSLQINLKALLACVDTFGRSDLRQEVAKINVPTLILHGTNDKPVPAEITAKDAARRIPGATLKLYEGASHGILVTEQDRVAKDLLGFLEVRKK